MSEALLKRLDAVASRLESYASGLGGSSSSGGGGGGGGSEGSAAFDAFVNTHVTAFVDAAAKQKETQQISDWSNTAFRRLGELIAATSSSKKPSDADLYKFLDPVVQILTKSQNSDNRSDYFPHQKAFAEAAQALNWISQSPPRPFVQDQLEAADFYLIKILTFGKKTGGTVGENSAAFAVTLKKLLQELIVVVGTYFKTGLEWNPKGGDLSGASSRSSAASSAGGAPPPPPPGPPPTIDFSAPAPTSSAPSSGGMGAVFDSLRTGDVTSGLKRVTNDMKSKNLKDKPVLEAKVKAPAVAAKAAKPVPASEQKEPKVYLNKGTWFIEHYQGGEVSIPEIQVKENVYILKCKNVSIRIPDKCKSIQVDNCTKVSIEFPSVVSIFEIFNSQRVTIFCTVVVPSIALDKSGGISINLNKESVKLPPKIITSSITEVNLVIPGATEEDDPVEIPLPEQYETNFSGGRLHTEAVAHSGN